MKLLSLFSGIGAFEKALDKLKIDYELVNFCEFDKYAVRSYCAIHDVDESKNLGDITKVDKEKLDKNIDLVTYGFPCQDISLAGKQKGMINEDGSLTRSGLFFEALDIIEATKPKVAIAENVKNLTSKRFNTQFQIVLKSLEDAGYNNYWQVLNAKDYGIPQNRERVFIVSIRKDIDTESFRFPKGLPLKLRLKDMLENAVNEKFYLDLNKTKILISRLLESQLQEKGEGQKVLIRQATKQGYTECEVGGVADLSFPNSQTRRGRVQDNGNICPTITAESRGICRIEEPNVLMERRNEYGKAIRKAYESGEIKEQWHTMKEYVPRKDGVANTLSTVQKDNYLVEPSFRIRKLTPKECFRLMGFDDEDFEKAEAVNSNTQLYKQAGNSIVVNVLEHILGNLLDAIPTLKE